MRVVIQRVTSASVSIDTKIHNEIGNGLLVLVGFEEGDSSELAAALGHIARARGMTEIAKATGIKREALYKALRPNSHPRLDTVQRVCKALGVKLTAITVN